MNIDGYGVNDFMEYYMRLALEQAAIAAELGEVPIGAVLVNVNANLLPLLLSGDSKNHNIKESVVADVIGKSYNQVESRQDPTAHAELLAISEAAKKLKCWRLLQTVLFVTKEPCSMCAGAIVLARIPLVVWGMTDPLRGGAISVCNIFGASGLNHHPSCIAGVLEEDCSSLVKNFFKSRRRERHT